MLDKDLSVMHTKKGEKMKALALVAAIGLMSVASVGQAKEGKKSCFWGNDYPHGSCVTNHMDEEPPRAYVCNDGNWVVYDGYTCRQIGHAPALDILGR